MLNHFQVTEKLGMDWELTKLDDANIYLLCQDLVELSSCHIDVSIYLDLQNTHIIYSHVKKKIDMEDILNKNQMTPDTC